MTIIILHILFSFVIFGLDPNIYKDNELEENSTLRKFRIVQTEGKREVQRSIDFYNLDVIIAVGYRVSSKEFFQTVQNKLEFAITGKTAPEIIVSRVDKEKPNMGLETWKNAPKGKILKGDVTIAKNYLHQKETKELNQIVSMYLDFAELQTMKRKKMTMKNWIERLDSFLEFNEYEILNNLGKVKRSVANKLALENYAEFRIKQDLAFKNDFDILLEFSK